MNILNMKNFLDTVNACTGKVNMLCPDGKNEISMGKKGYRTVCGGSTAKTKTACGLF